jgi:hypothetical protein
MIKQETVRVCICDKCGFKWSPSRSGESSLPKVCSKCKSVNWNKAEEPHVEQKEELSDKWSEVEQVVVPFED